MNFSGVDIENIKLFNGCCIVAIHSLTEDEIDFNGGKLKIVNKIKNGIETPDMKDVADLIKRMKKFHHKDEQAVKEYGRMLSESKKEADPNKVNHQDKQAVRRGVITHLPSADFTEGGWDYECEFDGQVGDEVWFDATYTREMIAENEGGFEIDGRVYLMIPTRSIYAVKKGDDIIGLNGFVIGRRLPNDRKHGLLFLPETSTARVEVVEPNRRDPVFHEDSPWSNTKVEKGDIVLMRDIYAIPLDATLAKTTDLVRFQTRVIKAYEK